MRVVGRDHVGGLVERGEPVEVPPHERADAVAPVDLETVRHVDQHERPGHVGLHRSIGHRDHRRESAERRPDEDRRLGERPADGHDVVRVGVERVVALGRPGAVAVATEVDRPRPPAGLDEQPPGAGPRVPGLAATVQQHDRRPVLGPVDVGGQDQPVCTFELRDRHGATLSSTRVVR